MPPGAHSRNRFWSGCGTSDAKRKEPRKQASKRIRNSGVSRSKLSPHKSSGDRGLYSEPNEQLAYDLGVKRIIPPKRGYRAIARLKHEHKVRFVKERHWHASVGGRISVLKCTHGLGRLLMYEEKYIETKTI